MNATERKILAITCFGHVMCHVYVLVFSGVLEPIAASLGATIKEVTSVGTIGYLVFGLGALPAGLLATRTNARFALQLYFILSAAASLVTGLSRSLLGLGFGLAFIGAAASLYHVSGLTLISQGIKARGKALGIHGIAGSAGITLAPLISMPIAELYGWRAAYLVIAIPGVIGFVLLLTDRRIPKAHVVPKEASVATSGRQARVVLFVLAVIIMGLNGFIYRGFLTVFPSYVKQQFAGSAASTGFLRYFKHGLTATAILATGMIGQYMGGYLSDKMRKSALYLLLLLFQLPFIVLIGHFAGWPLAVVSVLFTIIHFSAQPVENSMIAAVSPPRIVGSAYGVKFVLTFGLGSFGAVFAGHIAGVGREYARVFPALGVVLVLSVIVAAALSWVDRRAAATAQTGASALIERTS